MRDLMHTAYALISAVLSRFRGGFPKALGLSHATRWFYRVETEQRCNARNSTAFHFVPCRDVGRGQKMSKSKSRSMYARPVDTFVYRSLHEEVTVAATSF